MKTPRLKTISNKLAVARNPRQLSVDKTATRREGGRARQAKRLRLWLERGQCCAACGRFVEHPGGYQLDHITPLSAGGSNDDVNLQLLCVEFFMGVALGCHAEKTLAEQGGKVRVALYPDWLPTPSVPVHLVFGPPGSGKTTYAREQAAGKDVLDLDELAARMFRQPIYAATKDQTMLAIRARNKSLANLQRETWVVLTGTKPSARDWWVKKLRPVDVHVMETDEQTCLARIAADDRRPEHVKKRGSDEVRRWFKVNP